MPTRLQQWNFYILPSIDFKESVFSEIAKYERHLIAKLLMEITQHG